MVSRLIKRETPKIMQEAAEEGRLQKAFEENADVRAAVLQAGGKRMRDLIEAIDSNTSQDIKRADIETAMLGIAANWIEANARL